MKRRSGNVGCRLVATLLIAAAAARPGLSGEKDEAWLLQTNLLERGSARVDRLPNALILGDSISLGYTPAVKKKLAGQANVSRPGCNCGPSQFYLRSMRGWVGTNHWDVIHVNFGIWYNHYLKGPSDGMGLFCGRTARPSSANQHGGADKHPLAVMSLTFFNFLRDYEQLAFHPAQNLINLI